MRYGDLTKNQLKNQFNLRNISLLVDPYTLRRRVFETRYARVLQSIDLLVNGSSKLEYVTRDECAKILFDEFRFFAMNIFSSFRKGIYTDVIKNLIDHMQRNTGSPFSHPLMNTAFKQRIENDNNPKSSLKYINNLLSNTIDWEKKILQQDAFVMGCQYTERSVLT